MPCIYIFTSPKGKSYIGQTVNFEKRKTMHKSLANTNSQFPFHRAIRMYGFNNFQEEVIECEEKDLNLFERLFIAFFRGFGNVYNCTDGGEGQRGFKHSYKTKSKISAILKGRKHKPVSDETRKRMSVAAKGKIVSEITKAKISEILMGNQYNLGHKHTNEAKAKMSDSIRKALSSPEARKLMSERMKRVWEKRRAYTETGGTSIRSVDSSEL